MNEKINKMLESPVYSNKLLGYELSISQLGITEDRAISNLSQANMDEVCKLCSECFFDGRSTSSITFLCEGSKCKEASELYFEHVNDCAYFSINKSKNLTRNQETPT